MQPPFTTGTERYTKHLIKLEAEKGIIAERVNSLSVIFPWA
jgi:hypothetical protein